MENLSNTSGDVTKWELLIPMYVKKKDILFFDGKTFPNRYESVVNRKYSKFPIDIEVQNFF